jgi:GxxExxY protein
MTVCRHHGSAPRDRTAEHAEDAEVPIELGYRLDLLVNDLVIVEVKAVTRVLPIHEAQLLSYLKLSGRQVGLLINFHEPHLRDGIRRLVNNAPDLSQ